MVKHDKMRYQHREYDVKIPLTILSALASGKERLFQDSKFTRDCTKTVGIMYKKTKATTASDTKSFLILKETNGIAKFRQYTSRGLEPNM